MYSHSKCLTTIVKGRPTWSFDPIKCAGKSQRYEADVVLKRRFKLVSFQQL